MVKGVGRRGSLSIWGFRVVELKGERARRKPTKKKRRQRWRKG